MLVKVCFVCRFLNQTKCKLTDIYSFLFFDLLVRGPVVEVVVVLNYFYFELVSVKAGVHKKRIETIIYNKLNRLPIFVVWSFDFGFTL